MPAMIRAASSQPSQPPGVWGRRVGRGLRQEGLAVGAGVVVVSQVRGGATVVFSNDIAGKNVRASRMFARARRLVR